MVPSVKIPSAPLASYGLSLLAQREYSVATLRRKLLQKGYPDTSIEIALQEWVAKGFLSDQRFCEILINRCVAKGDGPLKIAAKLRAFGIGEHDITQCLLEPQVSWGDLLRKLYDKRFRTCADPKQKVKQIRYLQARGFQLDQIMPLFQSNASYDD